MVGRFGYFLVGGAAIFAGMVVQGDVNLGSDSSDHDSRVERRIDRSVDRTVDRTVDRIVDRAADRIEIEGEDGRTVAVDPAAKRALAAAVAELVRAEGSLVTARLDDDMPAAAIKQAEARRDAARDSVDRLAEDVRAASRGERDALRQNIRDDVREAARGTERS